MKCEDVETSPVKLENPEQPPLQNIWQVACYSSHILSHSLSHVNEPHKEGSGQINSQPLHLIEGRLRLRMVV